MEEFVTIASFILPHQVHILKGRLQSEGIPCKLIDEYTAYSQYYSYAVMGIKLQVRPFDFERAKAILIENGYSFTIEATIPPWYVFLNDVTSKIPWIGRYSLEKRVFFVTTLLILLIASPFLIFSKGKPALKTEFLTNQFWCLDLIYYDHHMLKTEVNNLSDSSECIQAATFKEDGTLTISNIYQRKLLAKWKLIDETHIEIYESDSLDWVFDGAYIILNQYPTLTLSSDDTELSFSSKNE